MTILAQRLLPDALWQRIQPLLPPPPSRGVFERLQEVLLDELGEAGQLDWSRVSVDSFSLRAIRGDHVGANPVDRAKPGSKLHLAADGGGLPLSLLVTGANTNDSTMFEALLDDIPLVRTPAGRRRRRPEKIHADKAYDLRRCRGYLTRRAARSASPAVGWSRLRRGSRMSS